jgi:hypothetical protein
MMVADLSPPMSVENIQLNRNRRYTQRGFESGDVLYFQIVEWHCPVTVLMIYALSTKKG